MQNTLGELPAFAASLYGGLWIGILYSIVESLAGLIRHRLVRSLVDALFWGLAGACAGLFLLFINGGAIRGYLLLGLVTGAWLFARFVALPIKIGAKKLFRALCAGLGR